MQLVFEGIQGSGEVQLDVLKAICGDTKELSMIDLGCGEAPTTRRLGFKDRVYIDIVNRNLREEHENFFEFDILEFIKTDFPAKTDVTISCDNLEHFWEEDGKSIIRWMQKNSNKQIIFTPEGRYMNVSDSTDNHPDTHKHSWTAEDFQKMGWATILFPNFHPTLGEGGLGAFFAFRCENLEEHFKWVKTWLINLIYYKYKK